MGAEKQLPESTEGRVSGIHFFMIRGQKSASATRNLPRIVPLAHEWVEHDGQGLFDLVEALYRRCSRVRDLIIRFHNSGCTPFPYWTGNTVAPGCSRAQAFLKTFYFP